jgi:hypothetical protein
MKNITAALTPLILRKHNHSLLVTLTSVLFFLFCCAHYPKQPDANFYKMNLRTIRVHVGSEYLSYIEGRQTAHHSLEVAEQVRQLTVASLQNKYYEIISSHIISDVKSYKPEDMLTKILEEYLPQRKIQSILIIQTIILYSGKSDRGTEFIVAGKGQEVSRMYLKYYLFDVTTKKCLLSNDLGMLKRSIEFDKPIIISKNKKELYWRFTETQDAFIKRTIEQLFNNIPAYPETRKSEI